MLKELFELSSKVDESLPPIGYSSLVAHIQIEIASVISINPIVRSDARGKESIGREIIYPLPDFVRSSGNRPLPVADTASYVLGVGKKGETRKSMYLELLTECYDYDGNKDIAISRIIEVVKSLKIEQLRESCSPWFDLDPKKPEIEPLEKARIIFLYEGKLVTERDSVKNFWGAKYAELSNVRDTGKCIISGETRALVAETLPVMVKGVPGSQSKGAALTSFNIDSVASRKWQKVEHAPIGFEVAERSHQMLNKLLREERHRYKQGNMAFVYWGEYDEGLNQDIWDDPEELWEDDGAVAAEIIFTSPDDPSKFIDLSNCDSIKFYLAILTGCIGRIAITRWSETTPAEISKNVVRYIECQKSLPKYKAKPIWQLANSCFRDPNKEQTDLVVKALVLNALWGISIPQSVVAKAIERIYLDLFSGAKDRIYHSRYRSQFQLLALYLNNMNDSKSTETVRRHKIARQLGAVAYLMHDAEMTARNLEDAGKTGVAGSLRALSTTPKQVFGRLYQNAILYHLPTPCNDGEAKKQETRLRRLKRVGKLLREEFGRLVEMKLDPETDLPNTFSLDENAWFHFGWAMREATFWAGVDKKFDSQDSDRHINQEEE